MKLSLVPFLAFVLSAASVLAAPPAKHTITHEDVWLMKRVGAPVPSPDGHWVIYSVTEPAYDAKEQWTDLWIRSLTDDSAPRRLTYSKGAEGGVDWAPDSRRIVFTAKREGDDAAQLYLLDLAGGEAVRLTSLTLGARQARWSPDGKQLLFVSEVFPGAADEAANKRIAKERKDRKYNARAYDQFPPRFWDKWLDDKRAHLFVMDAAPDAKVHDLLAGTKLAELPGFGGGNGDDGQNIEAVWTPDGQEVVFAVATNRDAAAQANVNTQVYAVAVSGGEPRRLTDDTASYGGLSFTPDGKTLLCLTDANTPGKVYDLSRLAAFPWPFQASGRRVLTADLDRAVSRYAVPTGGDRVYFTYEHAGLEKLYSLSLAGGGIRAEPSAETGCIGALRAGGPTLVGLWDSATHPPEVYRFGGAAPQALTDLNGARTAAIDWDGPEHFDFTSSRGKVIHNMLVHPPGMDPAKKYPLLVVIHGGAASMWRDSFVIRWNYHLLASPGYVVLLTDYSGSTGYGEEFARSIQLDPLKGPGDELNEAVDATLRRCPAVDAGRMAAAGASYGGHLANWLQATTTRFRCFVSHAGEADLVMQWGTSDSIFNREVNSGGPVWGDSKVWREQSPAMQAGNHAKGTGFTSPILITVGEQDFRVPMNNAIMWFALNQRLGVASRLIVFPEENHWILKGEDSRYWYGEVQGWLAKWLK